jgi:protein-disulfide isomerase
MPPDEIILETGDALQLSRLLLPIQPDDHVQGSVDARLTLVEYGDYQCPACGALFLTILQLHEQLAHDIRIVFRHYPLSGLHPDAQLAAEAAEAAGAQGKFCTTCSFRTSISSPENSSNSTPLNLRSTRTAFAKT